MRAQIAINKTGSIQSTDGKTVPVHGVLILRRQREFFIHLDKDPSLEALKTLIQTARSIHGPLVLKTITDTSKGVPNDLSIKASDPSHARISHSGFCLHIAREALEILQSRPSCPFTGTISFIHKDQWVKRTLPDPLQRLVSLSVKNLDAPSALIKASAANIQNLVSVAQNRSMRLFFMAVPVNTTWPAVTPRAQHLIEEECDDITSQWLTLLYETTLAAKLPIYHVGTISSIQHRPIAFERLLFPITPDRERPANHRILSTAVSIDDPDLVLI